MPGTTPAILSISPNTTFLPSPPTTLNPARNPSPSPRSPVLSAPSWSPTRPRQPCNALTLAQCAAKGAAVPPSREASSHCSVGHCVGNPVRGPCSPASSSRFQAPGSEARTHEFERSYPDIDFWAVWGLPVHRLPSHSCARASPAGTTGLCLATGAIHIIRQVQSVECMGATAQVTCNYVPDSPSAVPACPPFRPWGVTGGSCELLLLPSVLASAVLTAALPFSGPLFMGGPGLFAPKLGPVVRVSLGSSGAWPLPPPPPLPSPMPYEPVRPVF